MARLRAIVLAVLLLVPSWASAAITASADAANSTGSQADIDAFSALALTNGVATGDFVVGACGIWQAGSGISGVTVTDTVTTSYTVVLGAGVSFAAGVGKQVVFYGRAPSSGANSVTIDPSSVGNYGQCDVKKFAGVHTTPLDVAWSESSDLSGTSNAPADALTTLTANALLIGVGVTTGSEIWTAGANHTLIGQENGVGNQSYGSEYRIVTSATSYTVDMTINNMVPWTFGTIAFAEAGGGAAGTCTRLILGVGPPCS